MARLTKEQKDKIRKGYSEAWDSEDMIKYCCGKVADIAELPDGSFIPVEKERIKKDFCFGYSLAIGDSESFDNACEESRKARTQVDHFMEENTAHYKRILGILENQNFTKDCYTYSDQIVAIIEKPYLSQIGSTLKDISFFRVNEIIEALGGSCFMAELPGTKFTVRDNDFRIPTAEELNLIIEAYKRAENDHIKKLNAYLKRYGLNKVNSWTYWRDE